MPYFVKYSNFAYEKKIEGFTKSNLAVRYSEHESIDYALGFIGKVEWVWVDCFSKFVLTPTIYEILKKHFKICLVSPELQNHPLGWIKLFKHQLINFDIDAVCTKRPDLW